MPSPLARALLAALSALMEAELSQVAGAGILVRGGRQPGAIVRA